MQLFLPEPLLLHLIGIWCLPTTTTSSSPLPLLPSVCVRFSRDSCANERECIWLYILVCVFVNMILMCVRVDVRDQESVLSTHLLCVCVGDEVLFSCEIHVQVSTLSSKREISAHPLPGDQCLSTILLPSIIFKHDCPSDCP